MDEGGEGKGNPYTFHSKRLDFLFNMMEYPGFNRRQNGGQ